jgi:hypothetical protein
MFYLISMREFILKNLGILKEHHSHTRDDPTKVFLVCFSVTAIVISVVGYK